MKFCEGWNCTSGVSSVAGLQPAAFATTLTPQFGNWLSRQDSNLRMRVYQTRAVTRLGDWTIESRLVSDGGVEPPYNAV